MSNQQKLDRLLHDAEHALSGAAMARMMKDEAMRAQLLEKAQELIEEADDLDPCHGSELWDEFSDKEPF